MSEVILLSHAKQGVRRSLFYSGTAFSLQNKGDGTPGTRMSPEAWAACGCGTGTLSSPTPDVPFLLTMEARPCSPSAQEEKLWPPGHGLSPEQTTLGFHRARPRAGSPAPLPTAGPCPSPWGSAAGLPPGGLHRQAPRLPQDTGPGASSVPGRDAHVPAAANPQQPSESRDRWAKALGVAPPKPTVGALLSRWWKVPGTTSPLCAGGDGPTRPDPWAF